SIEGIDPEIASNLFAIMQMSIVTLRRAMTPDGFNVGINQGKVAGAGIDDHMHIHVVPRWNGDTNFMPVLAGAKVMPELLTATAAKLRAIFAEVEGGQ
ncbi:MAG: HIT domain-containing protein, partial [Chloroflexota bacterium]